MEYILVRKDDLVEEMVENNKRKTDRDFNKVRFGKDSKAKRHRIRQILRTIDIEDEEELYEQEELKKNSNPREK